VGREALTGLLEAGVDVLALYTYAQGSDDTWFDPPEVLARKKGIPIHLESNFNADHVHDRLRQMRPDFLFSFYFREMIQARFLELPRLGAYNLHGSMLPKFRGRAPINWVLVKGERATGVTLHAMTPKPDDGDIVGQTELPIAWDETALSLTMKAARAGRELVSGVVPKLIDGSAVRIVQKTLGSSTYFGGRKPEDSRLDFSMNAREAFNQIRAVADPWPNAFLRRGEDILKVAWALPSEVPCSAGCFRETGEGVLLGFAEGALRLHALRWRGQRSERPSDHAQWLRALDIPEMKN
jgi:methionyl-tRNA formyltransferase